MPLVEYLLREAKKTSENLKYLTELMKSIAKHLGVPPLPARPPAPPKERAKNGNGKSEGTGGGANGDGEELPESEDFYGGF